MVINQQEIKMELQDDIQREIKMYGCTRAQIDAGVQQESLGNPLMYAAGIISDAQQVLEFGDAEQARQFMNKAKYIIFQVMRGE
jgi:hypothetical protein